MDSIKLSKVVCGIAKQNEMLNPRRYSMTRSPVDLFVHSIPGKQFADDAPIPYT